jgi:hypothetical protein
MIMLSLALLGACDGLGRPVVDRRRPGQETPRECTRRRPRCDDVLGAPEELDVGAAPRIAGSAFPPCALAGQGSAQRIVGVFHECTLTLDASQGEAREIADSSLDNVLVQLDGHVQLRISNSQLFSVTLQSEPAADSELAPLLQLARSDLRRIAIRAELVELTSCFLDKVDLEASELSAVDVESNESYLRAQHATISAARLAATHFGECETLLLAGSRPVNSRFDACAGVTRIYDVEATGCTFDGQLESDDSAFADGRFGVNDATQLHSWDSSVDNAVFCREVDSFRFSAGAIVCSVCQGPLATAKADACFDTSVTNLEANVCKAFEIKELEHGIGIPETCDTFPRHERPNITQ